MQTSDEKILIIDFGSQYTQLIARKIRELGVYSEITTPKDALTNLNKNLNGIILSGSPFSADKAHSLLDPNIFKLDIPILGICYGMQLIAVHYFSKLSNAKQREFGKHKVIIKDLSHPLFRSLQQEEIVWMSHQDTVDKISDEFNIIAKSNNTIAAISHKKKPIFGLQFHPEVTHTHKGINILKNFLKIANCQRKWNLNDYVSIQCKKIQNKVKNKKVVSLISGGIDSLVATLLCVKALGAQKVFPIHIDSNLMRYNESFEVIKLLNTLNIENIQFIDAKDKFFNALKNISDPEEKRKIIGNLFIEILDDKIREMDLKDEVFICQGTLYTDLIESGKGMADVIKSHHNVNCPSIQRKKKLGLIIEPNSSIFKDEVRSIAKALSIPSDIIQRHPFPGPGLAIRILGPVDQTKVSILQKVDKIFTDEVKKFDLYDKIWQAFCVLIPMKSVAVIGDKRSYGYIIALRAVNSLDAMTADFIELPYHFLSHISTKIINEVPEVTRVVYDITSKPPATIEWE